MKAKFKKNQKITVKLGELYYNGIISEVSFNMRTWKAIYKVDYYKGGTSWTLTEITEDEITPNN